ncbi:TPA: glycosyltransferase family 2 protein [Photobacterium damselae]
MLNNPLVSVIIPTYNSSLFIGNAITSVLNQSYKNLEVIIVDDLSSDADRLKNICDKIFSEYNFTNYTIFLSKEKIFGGGARNYGVEISSGEYIAFLDSDDSWFSDKLSLQLMSLNSCTQYNTVVFTSLYRGTTIEKSEILPKLPYVPNSSIADYIFFKEQIVQTSTLLMRKDTFNQYKFDSSLIRHQDFDLVIRMSDKVNFIQIEKPLVFWKEESDFSTIKKGASFDFCKKFIIGHRVNLSKKSYSFYLSRTLLSTAVKNNRKLDYLRFILKSTDIIEKFFIVRYVFLTIIRKACNV